MSQWVLLSMTSSLLTTLFWVFITSLLTHSSFLHPSFLQNPQPPPSPSWRTPLVTGRCQVRELKEKKKRKRKPQTDKKNLKREMNQGTCRSLHLLWPSSNILKRSHRSAESPMYNGGGNKGAGFGTGLCPQGLKIYSRRKNTNGAIIHYICVQ